MARRKTKLPPKVKKKPVIKPETIRGEFMLRADNLYYARRRWTTGTIIYTENIKKAQIFSYLDYAQSVADHVLKSINVKFEIEM